MSSQTYSNLHERVEQAAEAALKRNGSVGPLELFQEMRLLQPAHVEAWRKVNEYYPTLQPWIQVGPEKFQKTLRYFKEWVTRRGLRPPKPRSCRRPHATLKTQTPPRSSRRSTHPVSSRLSLAP